MSRGPIRTGLTLIAILSILSPSEPSKTIPNTPSVLCEEARLRCAYRTGCGAALQHYLVGCAPGLGGKNCSETCQHALIALTSTDEGKDLMRCECDDDLCLQSKQRVEICRSSVTTAMNKTRVSCRIATWICNADALCQTALAYYNRFCKSMFEGRKCTRRCRNSLNILTRQEKAAKLTTCQCDGHEDYDCRAIQKNLNHLCYGKLHHGYRDITVVDGEPGGWGENDGPVKKKTSTKENKGIATSLDKRIAILFLGVHYVLKARQD